MERPQLEALGLPDVTDVVEGDERPVLLEPLELGRFASSSTGLSCPSRAARRWRVCPARAG